MTREMTSSKVVPLTRTLVDRFHKMKAAPHERAIENRRIKILEKKLKDGLLHTFFWVSASMNGTEYRVNAQHSSRMLSAITELPPGLKVLLEEWKVTNRGDLEILFGEYDNIFSTRTGVDLLKAHMGRHKDLSQISHTIIKHLITSIIVGERFSARVGDKGACYTPEDRAWMVHRKRHYLVWAYQFHGYEHLRRTSCLAMVHATYCANSEMAKIFWLNVATMNHPDISHPSRVLAKYLLKKVGKLTNKLRERDIYNKCQVAWDAFMDGRPTKLQYQKNKPLPEIKTQRKRVPTR